MNNYSELVIVFLVLPVLMQIILPLLMLMGFFLARIVSMMLGRRKVGVGLKKDVAVGEEITVGGI